MENKKQFEITSNYLFSMNLDDLAYQLTAYEKMGSVDYENYVINEVLSFKLKYDDVAIMDLWNEYCRHDGNYDDEIFYNDDDFFETYFDGEPLKAIHCVQFGNYNCNDDYVKFNGSGNLDSLESCDINELLNDNDFMQWVLFESGDYDEYIDDQEFIDHVVEMTLKMVKAGY